jgi:hypothetical protein
VIDAMTQLALAAFGLIAQVSGRDLQAALVQAGLAAFGLAALWMSTGQDAAARRWAPIVGLCGQPFWVAFALSVNGWALLPLSLAYTVVYIRGIWVQWRTPRRRARSAWFAE